MSDYGLLLKNVDGSIQVDSNYSNFVYHASGSISVSQGNNYINFPDTDTMPILAIRPSSTTFCCVNWITTTSTDYTGMYILGEEGSSGTIHWMTFIYGVPTPSGSFYGLIVRNASNNVVFTSECQYMKIVNVYNVSVSKGSYVNVSVSNANNYFCLQPAFSYYTTATHIGSNLFLIKEYAMGIKRISSSIVRVGTFKTGEFQSISGTADDAWISSVRLIELKK